MKQIILFVCILPLFVCVILFSQELSRRGSDELAQQYLRSERLQLPHERNMDQMLWDSHEGLRQRYSPASLMLFDEDLQHPEHRRSRFDRPLRHRHWHSFPPTLLSGNPLERPTSPTISASYSVHEAWVRHYASGLVPGEDVATDIVVDISGNVYVTGYSPKLPFGTDYFTVKYNTAGNELWAVRYDGGLENVAEAMAVDSEGNVYVTGYSSGIGTSYDYATVKYNTSGVQQWIARYNGFGNSPDYATAIAVDGAGNVYVTGWSYGSGTYYDFATIKYNPSGVVQWIARYNGPGNTEDKANAIAVDGAGNVYVTGSSVGSGTSYDYATVKYSASGVQQWIARYNGLGNSSDNATAIAVDGAGNVYVTGSSLGGTSYDFATIKYNPSGVVQWIAHYNGHGNRSDAATAITVDGEGNVYVTGRSIGSNSWEDYATIKYNASGVELWIASYNGSGNLRDEANAIAVDGAGNVYVTGRSYGSGTSYDYATIKYNASGVEQWIASYNGPGNDGDYATAIAVDGTGNVYVTGRSYSSATGGDYATIKYNASGVQQWITHYNGPGNSWDYATAIAVDGDGNVYVTGESYRLGTGEDYATIKYNASGVQQWITHYNGPGNNSDYATAITVDGEGNVYVTGSSIGSNSWEDYATIKYNASGVELWIVRYNGPVSHRDYATAIAVDGAGNVYVTGRSEGLGTYYDFVTIKYNASGVEQWVARYNGPGNNWDEATAIAVDGTGNVYVTGSSYVSGTYYDFVTIKYNASGVEQWVARYNGPENFADYATAIAVDGEGNVYVTGRSFGSSTSYDYATIKYNASGVQQWIALYNGLGNSSDYATAIAVDGAGNVYVTGRSYGSGTRDDYSTIKYNASGVEQWVARYNGPGNVSDYATAITVDGEGNVYVTGYSVGSGTSYDYATIKYNASGVEQWIARYNELGNSSDYATAIAVDGAGNVYVTGTSFGPNGSIFTTIKYTQRPTLVEEEKQVPVSFALLQNYPNPFNPSTKIGFKVPIPGFVSLKVFDVLGREVATLVNEEMEPGSYEVSWDATGFTSGVYFYRLEAKNFVETKKLVLMR